MSNVSTLAANAFLRRFALLTGALLLALAFTVPVEARQTPGQWVEAFWPTAKAAGISRNVYDRALRGFKPDADVIKRANSQAEFKTPIWHYMDQMVSEARLSEGASMARQHGNLLARIEQRYGVDRFTLLAIWGMESNYGAVLQNPRMVKHTINALATLAYEGGRRAKFGRTQLVAALRIIQRGDVSPQGMVGSWAGAMGHTQFIPTTFEAYAVDFDGDGHRNIWTSHADALASAANYLNKMGWESGRTWGYEVRVPRGYDISKKGERTLASWAKLGIQRVGGQAFPRQSDKATLYLPNGRQGPAFLLLKNFRVIKRYNNADSYALAVGHLSDRLRGGGAFVGQWPAYEKPLGLEEARKLQALLAVAGFYDGPLDGDIGSGSRAAIREYQRRVGLEQDGVATRALIQRMERGG